MGISHWWMGNYVIIFSSRCTLLYVCIFWHSSSNKYVVPLRDEKPVHTWILFDTRRPFCLHYAMRGPLLSLQPQQFEPKASVSDDYIFLSERLGPPSSFDCKGHLEFAPTVRTQTWPCLYPLCSICQSTTTLVHTSSQPASLFYVYP